MVSWVVKNSRGSEEHIHLPRTHLYARFARFKSTVLQVRVALDGVLGVVKNSRGSEKTLFQLTLTHVSPGFTVQSYG